MDKKVLLAVLAHPDDETFGMGGTLAMYARNEVEVYLVCATRGEVGEMGPQYMEGFESIAERREYELRCAAKTLGLTDVYFLGYRDSGMPGSIDNQHPMALAAQPQERVAADVMVYIRRLKPQVVVTFDPIGGYRHPDHIAIHKATVEAFFKSGSVEIAADGLPAYQAQKLYFQTIPHGILRVAVKLMPLFGRDPRKFGQNGDIDLVSIAEVDFPTHANVDFRAVAKIRDEASACHASQGGAQMAKGPMGWMRRMIGSRESYMRAYPEVAPMAKREKDLFEGVV
jgi:LmbE family N-acetylglucosaminyl deacetylase